MNCPNINIKEVRNEFNSIVEAFGGRPLTIDEFKSKDLRNKRAGVDDNAMQVAYFLWDKTNGDGLAALPEYVNSNISDEYTRIRAVVNKLLGVDGEQMAARPSRPHIREGVVGLFESNPELANAVYEALGFITKSKIETTKTPGEIINELFSRQERGQISLAGEDVDIISKSRNNPTEENIQELEKLYNDLIGNLQDAIVNEITPQQKQQAQQLYSQYLDTIFPDSKVKDIVYRNESKEKGSIFNNFRKDKENTKYDLGFYFTTQKGANDWFGWNQIQIEESEQQHKFDNKIFQYILNITNPKIQSFKEYFESNSEKGFKFFKEEVSEAIKNNNDALIARDVKDISNEEQFIVFEPEQIHILGSKQDIEGFKEFVDKNNSISDISSLGKLQGDLMESEKGQIGVNKQQLLMLLGPTMYNKPLAQVAVKELLQNSFDAIKARMNITDNKETGNIDIKVDYDNRTISIKDDGIGMTPDIVKNAFLSIGGTNKEGLNVSERSGGFGLAKVQFLLGSEYVKVITVRDGIKTSLEASAVQLYNDDFIINKEQTNEPNGSYVEVKIPESYTTPEGTKREIEFPGRWRSDSEKYRAFDILDKPLIGNVNVSFTHVKEEWEYKRVVPIGENTTEETLPPLFSKIDFSWGSADLYMSTEKKENPNHRILSSGIYQFDYRFIFKDWEYIPYDIVVNIKPSVSSTSEQYPFNNQRENFKNTVTEDIKSLNNYLDKYASGESEKDAKAVFSNITGLPKVDPNRVLTSEEREKLYADVEKTIAENKQRRIEQGLESAEEEVRKVWKLIIDKEGVRDAETGKVEVSNEKDYGTSFKAEREIERVEAIETTNFNPVLPQYHNNTNFDYLKIPGAVDFFSDFGSVVLEMVRFAGNELGYSYRKLKSEDEKFFAGVSIDKKYGGVHIRKIINAIFINPLAFNVSSLEEAVGVALHVTIHEINHTTVSGEGANFTTALGILYGKIYATGKYGLYEGLFRSVYKKHFETFKQLKNEYDKSSTRNLSESFSGDQIKKSITGNVQRDVDDVSAGQSSAEGYTGNQENNTKDKTGDVILSKFLGSKQDTEVLKEGALIRAPKYYSSNDIYEKNHTRLKYIGRALTNKIKNNGWVNLARVKKLNDIYTKNENSPFTVDILDYDDYKTTNEKLRKIQIIPKQSFLEKLRSDAEVEFEQYLNSNEWVREFIYGPNEDLFGAEQKRSIVDNKHAEVQKKSPNKGVQLNLFDEIVDSQGKVRNKMNRESVELVYRLAKRLSRLTGITFSVVTMDEAVAIRNAKNGTNLTADDARGRGFGGFYDMGTKTAYLVDERMESHITVHEVFGHPILQALRMNPKTHEAYNKLILEAAKYSDEIENVYKIYGKNYKSGLAIEDEMIIRVLELHVNNKLGGSRLLGVAREIMREITSFLIDVLNLIPGVEIMRPDLTIERLAEYALYGRGKLGLFDGDPRVEADKAAKRLAKKLNANTFNKLSYGFIKINDILELSNAYALDAVKEWAEENQTSTAEKVIAGIQAELLAVDYESGKIYDYNGSEVASFVSSKDGAYTYISNIDTGKLGWDIVLRTIIARSDTLFPSTIRIASSSIPVLDGLVNGDVVFQSAIEHSIAKGIIPRSAVSSVNHNGADYVEIDTLFAKNNEFEYLYAESKVSSQTANAHTPSEFINTIIDGLSAQIANLERKPTNRIESIERLKDLVDQINSATHVQAAEIFINYASAQNGPVMSVSRKVRELVKQMAKNELIDNSVIRDMESNFLTLYKNAIKNIGAINSDPYSILNVLPDKSREILSSQIQSIEQELSSIENSLRNLKTYAYKNQLAIEGAKVGSTTIGDRLSGNILIEDEDISGLSSLLFGMAFSNKEQMRALHKIVLDVQADVHRRVETDGVLNNLKEKWDAVRSGKPFSTYERFYEKNRLGKATGYLISDLLYGQFNRDYDLFKQKLAKKYKLNSPNDIPTNKKERIKYLSEKDEWLNSHAERMFTPEYYKLRNSLSEDARQALDDAGMAIRMFLNKFKDADGFIDTSLMSPQDLEKFRSLKKAKQNLSNIRYADGSAKSGIALDIANEVAAYNKKISDGLRYKPNYSLFEKKMAEMKSKLSAAEFIKWKSINTRITYKQEFWDSLDSNAKEGQTKEWQDMYDARANILRIYRNLDSIDVSAARLDSNKTARETVEFFDRKLAETRTKRAGKSNFSEIAEIVPTDEYLFEEEKARNNPNKAAWAEFIKRTHFVGPGGKLTKYSQWTKIQPKDKSMIVTEPSSIWSELDKTSAFYNQNYDESRSEDGLQPRRDLYDNSKEFNKIKKDKADYEFYNAILDAYRKANSMYSYNPNMSPLRLAQITGPFLHKLSHGDSKLKAILGTLRDKFVIRAYEPGYGDTESRGMFRADGSPVMFVPTKYRTMLDQPDQISRDLLGSFAMYYSAALNHNLMSRRVDDIETILQGIHDTKIKSKNASKRNRDNDESETRKEGATRMYKRSYDFVKSSVYGYELGKPYNIPLWKDKDGRRIYMSLAKPIKDFLNYARKTNLAGNVVAIFSNFMTAGISSKIEAACGTHMDSKAYSAAGFEVAKNMPDIMATSTFDRGSNKIIALMRYMNVVRSNENDMKGLHGSKLINTISSNIWYGPYTAGDFAVKSRMMVAVMMNYKLYDGSYYSKEMFLSRFYPDNRVDGEKVFDSIGDTLYDAFEVNKDGVLAVKEKFKEYVTDDTLSNVYSLLGVLGRKLDGTLTGSERSRIHSDAFASAILLHRGWLVNALQERFSPEIYSYEKQMMISGQYKGENFGAASKIMWKFLANKISDIERDGLKGNLNFKLGSMKNEFSGSQLYNARKIIGEIGFLIILSAITALLSSLVPRNAFGDKDEESAEMWAYVLSLRVAMEMFAVYSPADVYNIIGSPTAAEGTLENFKGIFEMFADGSYDELVQSGKYRNRTKLERAAIKLTPGYKQIYERAIHPDLGATERFLIGNIPTGPITIASKVFDRRTEQEKRMEERRKQALRMRKEFEEKNADKIKEMKKRKREQFNRRPLFGE